MLEGQVAALSSGKIDADRAIEILETLFESPLYRSDQNSFLLYPMERAQVFLSRNRLSGSEVRGNPLLAALVAAKDKSIIVPDSEGDFHFHPSFSKAADLQLALDKLALIGGRTLVEMSESSRQSVLDLYETLFQHRRFTGRSGAMHAYEGIGSVYWHMIGKLLVAAQECFWHAVESDQLITQRNRLGELYYQIRDGLGFNKTAGQYGAFPTDPHSHTPASGGARQPGMTGQVKEEILRRFGELGIRIQNGQLHFRPHLLRRREFLLAPATFQSIKLDIGSLAFTYCGVPIVYRLGDSPMQIRIIQDGNTRSLATDSLTAAQSEQLFQRTKSIRRIEVDVPGDTIQFE
jgi:hypothetical protein